MSSSVRLIAPALALALALAACGGASTAPTSSSTPATSPAASTAPASSASAVCADVAALKASVAALTTLTSADAGTGAVMTAVTDVKTSVEGLLVSGKEAAAKPLASLQAAVDALQATISGLGSQPTLGAKVTAVKAGITQVASAAVDVEAALATTCPAS